MRSLTFRGDYQVSLSSEVKRFESYLIEYALEQTNGNQVRAAELLNLNYTTLNAKVKRYGLDGDSNVRSDLFERDVTGDTEKVSQKNALIKFEPKEERSSIREKLGVLKGVVLQLIEEIESLSFAKTVGTYDEVNMPDELRRFESHLIRSALDRNGGNQTRAAKTLGIKVTTLNNKIKRYRIPIQPEFEQEAPSSFPMMSANDEARA